MSNTKWTASQQNAIDAFGGSLIVSAAAGSGKTAVLVERVTRLITDETKNVPADKILVVTYTKAAANELRARLSRAISDKLKDNPGDPYLLNQQIRLQCANISTIHSFCSKTVKEYFATLDIDRDYRIAEEGELSVLKSDAMKMTLDSLYAQSDKDFLDLLGCFSTDRDEKELTRLIYGVYDFLLSHPFPDKWMADTMKLYSCSETNDLIWYKEIILPYISESIGYISRLTDIMNDSLNHADEAVVLKLKSVAQEASDFRDLLLSAYNTKDLDKINEVLNSYTSTRFPSVKGYTDDPYKCRIQDSKSMIREEVESLKKTVGFSNDIVREDVAILRNTASVLFKAVKLYSENFSDIKRNRRIADFSDLEHWMIKLLYKDENTLSDEAITLKNRFDHILVDEYQDANETQEYIFRAISRGKDCDNLFVVGDMKQSIYGFRLAMPEMFKNRRQKAVKYDPEDPEYPACIILEKNFRSSKIVLDFVNYIFSQLMSESVGDIEYNDDEKLIYNDKGPKDIDSSVEFDILDFASLEEKNESVAEAKYIAKRIKEIIESGAKVYDKKNGQQIERNARFSDFSVLMRSESKYSPVYVETLIKCGVPAYSKKSYSFLNSYEIMIVTNLLRVIDNPTIDLALLSVLMSPVYAFTADDMARIRLTRDKRHKSLYLCLKEDAENGNEKSINFLSELQYYREISVTMLLDDFISLIYERTSVSEILTALSSSNLPKANMRLLLEYAGDYQRNTHKGLSKFISYLDSLIINEMDLQGGADLDSGSENAVRVMSVHTSKGLEFPFVFLANTCRRFTSDASNSYLLDSRYGFAVKRKDTENNVKFNTLPYNALKIAKKTAEMSEELRILYVALTRAKQKMIVISTFKPQSENTEDALEKRIRSIAAKISGCKKIEPFSVRSASTSFDWIVMCALMHRDGKILRNMCENYIINIDRSADFDLDINIWNTPVDETDIKNISADTEKKDLGFDAAELLRSRGEYKYKYEEILELPSSLSVTEIAHRNDDTDFSRILNAPLFLKGSQLSGAQRGTAFHRFLQYADFRHASDDLEKEITLQLEKGFLTESEADSIDREKAKKFFESDIVKRANKAEKVFREYKFSIRLDPKIIDPDISSDFSNEKITLNGCVDLAFVEDGKLVIVDYKTDRTKDMEKLRLMYKKQLHLYQSAMQGIMNYKADELIIYSIYNSASIRV